MTQKNINIGTSSDKGGIIRRAAFLRLNANATDAEQRLSNLEIEILNYLNKIITSSQTVAGEVEFLSDITVPTASLILGKDGARIGSSARALAFTDARERKTLFAQYFYDDYGGTSLTFWNIDIRQTFNVCPDSAVALADPQELPFSGATGNTLTRSFSVIPKTVGTLRVQSWEGSNDTGAVLADNSFNILAGDIDNVTLLELKMGLISEIGDMQFVRFSGVQLAGSLSQSSGIFIGQECPYLDSDVQLLIQKTLVQQDTIFLDYNNAIPNPSYKEGRVFYDMTKNALSYYNDESETTVNLGQEQIVKVCNNTGSTISNGEAVRVDGSDGGLPCIVKSIANNTSNARVAGVATHDIPDGDTGYITVFGSIGGVDTSSFTEGDILFLSTDTAGELVNTEQPILHPVALVLTSDVNGEILANPRGIVNITAIAQTRGTSHNQQVTSTPVVCYCFDLNEFELNVTVDQALNPDAGDDGYSAKLRPASIGATGFYRFTFSISLSSGSNQRVSVELYINGSPSGLVANIDLNNPSTDFGTATLSGVTESTVTPSDTLEMYVYTDVGASREITFDSALFGIERIGNA